MTLDRWLVTEVDADVVRPGVLGLVVVLALVVATALLLRSFVKQLRRVDFDEGDPPRPVGAVDAGAPAGDGAAEPEATTEAASQVPPGGDAADQPTGGPPGGDAADQPTGGPPGGDASDEPTGGPPAAPR